MQSTEQQACENETRGRAATDRLWGLAAESIKTSGRKSERRELIVGIGQLR